MSETRTPRLVRDFSTAQIETREQDGRRQITFAASSEAPVERFFGTEILSHKAGAIRMARIAGGAAPLLFNHDWADPVGMVTAGRIQDGRLVVDAHFFETARARDVQAMVEGGLKNVSIGYEIHNLEERSRGREFLATDWEPLEVSIVTVPADPSVGMGREHESAFEAVMQRAGKPAAPAIVTSLGGKQMNEEQTAAIETRAAPKTDSAALERLRIKTITDLGRQHRIDDATVRSWIDDEACTPDDAARRVLDVLTTRAGDKGYNPSEIGMSKKETQNYSVFKAVRAILNKDWKHAGLELEAHKTIQQRLGGNPLNEQTFFVPVEVQSVRRHQQRDLTVAGQSGSQFLVGTENMSFIDLLRNRSVAMRMGATRMTGLVGNVTIPRETAQTSTFWLTNEATQITESQPTIGQLAMSPKHVGAYTEISRLLALQASPDAETLVMNDLAIAIGLAADLAIVHGSGGSGQPQGIVGTSGVGSVTGTSIAYAGVLEFQTDIGNALREGASCGYVTTPSVAALLMQRVKFTNTASPLWDGSVLNGNVCGFPGMSSAQISSGHLVFGDWSQVIMAEWGSLAIEVNPYANFQAGIVGIRGLYAMDVGVRIPSAFSVSTAVT